MKAEEALALTNKSQLEIQEKLKVKIPKFIEQQFQEIQKQAERGFKSAWMNHERLWDKSNLVEDEETGEMIPEHINLYGFDSRVMRDRMTEHFRALGYKVTRIATQSAVQISWGAES